MVSSRFESGQLQTVCPIGFAVFFYSCFLYPVQSCLLCQCNVKKLCSLLNILKISHYYI